MGAGSGLLFFPFSLTELRFLQTLMYLAPGDEQGSSANCGHPILIYFRLLWNEHAILFWSMKLNGKLAEVFWEGYVSHLPRERYRETGHPWVLVLSLSTLDPFVWWCVLLTAIFWVTGGWLSSTMTIKQDSGRACTPGDIIEPGLACLSREECPSCLGKF